MIANYEMVEALKNNLWKDKGTIEEFVEIVESEGIMVKKHE